MADDETQAARPKWNPDVDRALAALAEEFRFADPEAVERERRERHAAERYQTTRERLAPLRARLPAKDHALLLDEGLHAHAPLNAVQTWLVRTPLPFFVLGGVIGCGKTLAGAWAIAELGGVLVDAVNLVERVAPWFHEKRSNETIEIERAPVIVLDDLGLETPSERFASALLQLVNRRQGLRTLITTNLAEAALRERYPDARLWSRLDAGGRIVILSAEDAPSLRGRA